MSSDTSSYEGEERRNSNSDIRATKNNTGLFFNSEASIDDFLNQYKEMVPTDNDKRKWESSNDNFQKPQKKNKPSTRASKKANGPTGQPFVQISFNRAEMRIRPSNLWGALQGLSDAQISAITDMGFQSILSMNARYIDTKLGYWLLVNYDHKRNELNLGRIRIKITPSKVHEVFGIPMGKITIVEKNIRKKGVHPAVDQFRTQFDRVKIRIEDVIEKLKANTDGGRLFNLNFLVLFNTILGETNTVATVNQKFLTSVVNDSDICNMDWCSYMITCLNRTKEEWNAKYHYNGPLILLALVYAHHYQLNTDRIMYDEGEREDEYESQHQSEYQDEGDKFQSNEDQRETQGVEENHATHSKHHGLNLQMPIDTLIKRVIDDYNIPLSFQSQPETPVDASSLDGDGNVELLEPIQDQCALVENVSRMLDCVEKLPSPQSDIICVQGYKVKRSTATILEAIFKEHGDIAADCVFKTDSVRSSILEVICEVVRRIQTNDVIENPEEIECQLSDAEAANINVSWLRAHFEAINKRKEISKAYSLLMETKANTILVKRAAQMDLKERSVELVAAREQFKKAERCVIVLHLVEKSLNDSILESKAKIDSWVNH